MGDYEGLLESLRRIWPDNPWHRVVLLVVVALVLALALG
jgi:hypothetical protein